MNLKWQPDQTFYPSPKMAMQAPPEELAFVVTFNPTGDKRPDALCVVNVNGGEIVGRLEMPNAGDELHHFGWNACSAALCPYAPHPHVERRYLIVPGIRSSRIHVIDVKDNPESPKLSKVIEPGELAARAGYSRPHTIHCGAEGVYISALGNGGGKGKAIGEDGPGGVFLLDHYDFNVLGRWEVERGPQFLAYDFWWHLGFDSMITSEWGTPSMIEDGVNPELLLGGKYGHALHVWDLRRRRHKQTLDLGAQHQMALELRPAHDPTRAWGFAGVVVSTEDLSASIWLWRRESNGEWTAKKVITIPAEAAEPEQLPPLLQGFKAVPPIITDLNLSLDDKFLYVSCWATGEMRQYDVSNPDEPKMTGSVKLGGVVNKTPHPKHPDRPLSGGPQMVEVSRDGKRVYFTNSLYDAWDKQFYPDGIDSWMVRLNAKEGGGLEVDKDFFVEFGDFQAHQIRLQGGDSSSDSFCYPG